MKPSSLFDRLATRAVFRLLAGIAAAGSVAWSTAGAAPWPFNKEEKPGKPDRIMALWNDTVMTQPNQPPIRGFGGRLMFYEGKKEAPVKIEGTLVVYAFDETGRSADNTKPDVKFVFTPDQLPAHYSKSKIGHSYSVWLPWDAVGGVQKEVTLIARFEPKDASAVISQPARQLLPGRIPPDRIRAVEKTTLPSPLALQQSQAAGQGQAAGPGQAAGNTGVLPAAYEAPVAEGPAARPDEPRSRQMMTTTIAIPAGLASGMAVTAPQGFPPPGQGRAPLGPNPQPRWSAPRSFQPAPQENPPPQSSSAPGRSRPLGEPLARLARDRGPWRPHPAAPPYAPGSPPAPDRASAGPAPQSNAGSTPN